MLQSFDVLRNVVVGKNKLGEDIKELRSVHHFKGYIDLMGGSDQQSVQNANIADSTHLVFTRDVSFKPDITDFVRHNEADETYEVTFTDNPMQRNHHLEIFLRSVV